MSSNRCWVVPSCCLVFVSLFIAAVFLQAPSNSQAQEVTAAITGKVIDPSGVAIADATFTATDQLRGTTWSSLTNAEGFYSLPRIPVGTYNVRVEAKGFQTAVQSGVLLQINQTTRLDFQLKPGSSAVVSPPPSTTERPRSTRWWTWPRKLIAKAWRSL